MKTIKISAFILALTILLPLSSCLDLDELNEDPNNPIEVSSNYILTYVLTNTAQAYKSLGEYNSNVSGTMQYIQVGTNFSADNMNYYDWSRASWSGYYDLLRNIEIINKNAKEDGHPFFEAISLTLRAFLFGTITDLFGDSPYSESLQADNDLFFPKYDEQQYIYKGILEDLKNADELLSRSDIGNYKVLSSSDVLYGGNAAKWRKFANSLRLRYCMRLINKESEMSGIGVNIITEFNEAVANSFTSNSDDANVDYLGTTAANSAPGGLLNSSNPPYNSKPCATIVDTLQSINDPRLYRWVMPVQHKWDYTVSKVTTKTVVNMFGDSYSVQYWPTLNPKVDTSLYVGLPMGLAVQDAMNYNKGDDAATYNSEQSPYISYMHGRYRKNSDTYIQMDLMMYSEVEFLLAEAAERGIFIVSGTAETHYKSGILASMNRWGISDGSNGFSFNSYYADSKVNYSSASTKLERIMEQKWIALWLNVEPWFDWRRTGYPNLKAGPVAEYGSALPLRFMYPEPNQDEKYLVNYNTAVDRLESTIFVPNGQSKDHTYSKMWILQGTGKPY
ncbi:MAG: SusD/RagB family nutrient-binding outer membrane lipoprotein [Bacteroidales bacterium]|nr:SusD/RagB family nutrient-binding outer membrane lipoprotein [Bacteroidales bacterium]